MAIHEKKIIKYLMNKKLDYISQLKSIFIYKLYLYSCLAISLRYFSGGVSFSLFTIETDLTVVWET